MCAANAKGPMQMRSMGDVRSVDSAEMIMPLKYRVLIHPHCRYKEIEIRGKIPANAEYILEWVSERALFEMHQMLCPEMTSERFWNPDNIFLVPERAAETGGMKE